MPYTCEACEKKFNKPIKGAYIRSVKTSQKDSEPGVILHLTYKYFCSKSCKKKFTKTDDFVKLAKSTWF